MSEVLASDSLKSKELNGEMSPARSSGRSATDMAGRPVAEGSRASWHANEPGRRSEGIGQGLAGEVRPAEIVLVAHRETRRDWAIKNAGVLGVRPVRAAGPDARAVVGVFARLRAQPAETRSLVANAVRVALRRVGLPARVQLRRPARVADAKTQNANAVGALAVCNVAAVGVHVAGAGSGTAAAVHPNGQLHTRGRNHASKHALRATSEPLGVQAVEGGLL
jgi:hypothetical protein